MPIFNYFYLLGSVLFSFLAPLYTIYIDAAPVLLETIKTVAEINITDATPIDIIKEKTINYTQIFLSVYVLISSILLIRFGKNLINILQKVKRNTKKPYQKSILVLVDDQILPHTFWNYIFINKRDYENQKIEQELFTHELTHVVQKHTFDVLVLELIQILFWINPFFILLKKAVHLNHEFLADQTVINQHKNTIQYQHLLLNSAAWKNDYYLASNLNYSLTKKRLLMMTTKSSHTKILLKKLAVVPLLAGFVFLFAERVEAQEVIYEQEIVTRNISDDIPLETIEEQIFTPTGEKTATGFTDLKGIKYYFVTIGNTTKHFNKDGRLTDNVGTVISNKKTNASDVIPGNYITKTYFNGKVFCEFNDNKPYEDIEDSIENYKKFKTLLKNNLNKYNLLATKFNEFPIDTRIITLKELDKLEMLYNTLTDKEKEQAAPFPKTYSPGENNFHRDGDDEIREIINSLDTKYDRRSYQELNKRYESQRNATPHFVKSSKERQETLKDLFSTLGTLYFKLSKENKQTAKRPIHPHDPYLRLMKDNKVFYKLRSELTEKDKLLIPPPPPPPNASKEGILRAIKAYKAWENRTGNSIPPPPPPIKKR